MADTAERMSYRDYQMALDDRYETYDPELRARVREEWNVWVEEHVSPAFITSVKNMGMWRNFNGVCPALRYYRKHYGSEVKFG